jgi:hypothetical protein
MKLVRQIFLGAQPIIGVDNWKVEPGSQHPEGESMRGRTGGSGSSAPSSSIVRMAIMRPPWGIETGRLRNKVYGVIQITVRDFCHTF